MERCASRVLIVDDMPINRMILASLLATSGVHTDQAEGGEECLRLCRDNEYDLILLDHRMPDLDGVDTLVSLKDIFKEKGRVVPVVCHTTEEGRKNINLYKAAGFADVLIKPVDPKQLSGILLTYLPESEDPCLPDDARPVILKTDEEPEGDLSLKAELEELPGWLKDVEGIDAAAGLISCGDASDYADALLVFHSSIEDKARDIEHHFNDGDWSMYKLSVHSLKSMARLVGARGLNEAAAALEEAVEKNDTETIKRDTPELLSSYRKFTRLLEPLNYDASLKSIIDGETGYSAVNSHPGNPDTILLIDANPGIFTKGITTNLSSAGFKVITIADEPDLIIRHRFDAGIIIYYPGTINNSHISLIMNLLGEICQDDSKILCLVGEAADLKTALSSNGAYRICRSYTRPIDMPRFIRDMNLFMGLQQEYYMKKTVFVVDDDPDYLSLIDHWLSDHYNVSKFRDPAEIFEGLQAARPDLILLDYEMPQKSGFELMKDFRTSDATKDIPVIFLTGSNDRDDVCRILRYKPDGYLLKTTGRNALLDALGRFFSQSMFERSKEQ